MVYYAGTLATHVGNSNTGISLIRNKHGNTNSF